MRKTSRILGIIGSVLALVLGGFAIIDACFHTFMDDFYDYSGDYYYDDYYYEDEYESLTADKMLPAEEDGYTTEPYIDPFAISSGCSVVLGGLLGILGSVLAKRYNTAAGILFIVSAVLTLFSSAFIAGVLFVIAAVFALKRERSAVPMMLVPVSGYYPAYPPYGAYPPPYPPPAQTPPADQAVLGYPPYGAYPPTYTPPAHAPGGSSGSGLPALRRVSAALSPAHADTPGGSVGSRISALRHISAAVALWVYAAARAACSKSAPSPVRYGQKGSLS